MDGEISSMDESVIPGCNPWMEKYHPWMEKYHLWMEKCHPWMKVSSMDDIHGWRNIIHG